jgi:uncharacterized lipoprotein YmbA
MMRRLTTSAFVLVLLAGCASPAARFYTLSATPGPAAPAADLTIAVGPVTIPAVVDRPQLVVQAGPNEVRMDEFHRWAAPLANTIARVVAANLVQLLGTPRVILTPPALGAETDYRVAIQVQRFDSALGEAATLDAVWVVSRSTGSKSQTGRTTVREAAGDQSYEALAAAHSRALDRLSRDIAAAVQTLAR